MPTLFHFMQILSADWNDVICPRKLPAVYNTTAEYNSIDLIPNGVVWVSDTDISRKETSLSFLFIELV